MSELDSLLLGDNCRRFVLVGSRVTCNPPPKNTDEDILVDPVDSRLFLEEARRLHFHLGGSEIEVGDLDKQFYSLRNGEINLIVAKTSGYYDRFLLATRVAKELNLLLKADRIVLFDAIVYGASPAGAGGFNVCG